MVMELAKKCTIYGDTMLMGILSAFLKTTANIPSPECEARRGDDLVVMMIDA